MTWKVAFGDEFDDEFEELPLGVQEPLLAAAKLLGEFGPQLGRPYVDTLEGSRYANMKELRFDAADGVWRVAFAFDPQRSGILLIAGDKSGVSTKRFYKQLITKADTRYAAHLKRLAAAAKKDI
jgi:hypothetical protein